MAALKKMASSLATVVRAGIPRNVSAVELVPGDVVNLEAGNVIPADLRLLEVSQFKVEEAALTGESVPAEKDERPPRGPVSSPRRPERTWPTGGTAVTYGRAVGGRRLDGHGDPSSERSQPCSRTKRK